MDEAGEETQALAETEVPATGSVVDQDVEGNHEDMDVAVKDAKPSKFGWFKAVLWVGPAWVASAIAAGPATMASVLGAGSQFQYKLLWVVILSAFLGMMSQLLSMRLGLLTEDGIVSVVQKKLGKFWAWVLVVDTVIAAGLAQLVLVKGLCDVSEEITGLDARIWAAIWSPVLALSLTIGGYKLLEFVAKILVVGLVGIFVAALFTVSISSEAASGLIPTLPAGSGNNIAAILGGAVHITLITMQSYTMKARGWNMKDYRLACIDIVLSMLLAFGTYSVAIFLVAAAELYPVPEQCPVLTPTCASLALEPIAGSASKWLFLVGLWCASFSTVGGNSVIPPFLVADKLGWGTTIKDMRFRIMLGCWAFICGVGVFLEGDLFQSLRNILAVGLIATPFALVIVLYMLNDEKTVGATAGILANATGLLLLGVSWLSIGYYLYDMIDPAVKASSFGPISDDPANILVLIFTFVITTLTFVLIGFFVHEKWMLRKQRMQSEILPQTLESAGTAAGSE